MYKQLLHKTNINYSTSYSSNSKPSITTTLGRWLGAGRSNTWASSHVIFSCIRSSFSILTRLLFARKVLFFFFLEIDDLAPSTSFAMYPDLSTFDHELGSANSACWIDEEIGHSELSFKWWTLKSIWTIPVYLTLTSPWVETPFIVLLESWSCQQIYA